MARRQDAERSRRAGRGGHRETGSWPILDPASASTDEVLSLLERGDILGYEVVPTGTNYTFYTLMSADGGERFVAIYKPRQGENPLWDFPHGTLYRREHAAYVASRYLGWPRIPPTIVRDGPFGIGMVQLFVATERQWDFSELRRQHRDELMQIALFDLLVNNADRKAGHCLLGRDGRIWAIDHGLTFNTAPKLRTVLWDYCGEPIPRRLLGDLESLRDDPSRRRDIEGRLGSDLTPAEVEAFYRRLERILLAGTFPRLDPNRNIPWPLV